VSPILGIYASQISGHLFAPSGAYDSIATNTITSGGTSSITFSSIPSTYTHLQLRCITKAADTALGYNAFAFRFNGDTGSNYVAHQFAGNGGSVISSYTAATTSMTVGYTTVSHPDYTNVFASTVVDILDYANTNKYTTMRSLSGNDLNDGSVSSRIRLGSGLWLNTSAINSITILDTSSTFTQYTQFALYGIKGN
jgi:hypothetical protein